MPQVSPCTCLAQTQLAGLKERGVLGSPTFIVGDDLFLGNDRLGFREERLGR